MGRLSESTWRAGEAADPATVRLARELGAVVLASPWFLRLPPFRKIGAITFGRRIYLRDEPGGWDTTLMELLRHELEHVAQYRREGVIPFLYEYFREYLIHRTNGLDAFAAYRAISFEQEAREAEKGWESAF